MTHLHNRYIKNKYTNERKRTVGVDNYKKDKLVEDKKILLKVWDTVGQENVAVMTKSHYKIAHAIILVCSIDNKDSFNNLNNWLEGIREMCEVSVKITVMANKCDVEKREVPIEKLKELAEANGLDYIEASAKQNINIRETFDKLFNEIYSSNYNKNKGFELEDGTHSSGAKRLCC